MASTADLAARLEHLRTLGGLRRYEPVLGQALVDSHAEIRAAAATSLGVLDEPAATKALVQALGSSDVELVKTSARGLAVSFRQLGASECDALAVALVRAGSDAALTPALEPLSRAIASCEATDVEPMLRSLLDEHEDAALAGLSRLARSRKKLQKASLVALVDRALSTPSDARHLAACLEPAARVPWPVDLGERLLHDPLPAVVALARVYGQIGAPARPRLVTLAEAEPVGLDAMAARFEALRALGARAEPTFARVLAAHLPEGEVNSWAKSARGATFAHVLALAPAEASSPELRELLERTAQLEGEGARLDEIRCTAATRVVGSAFDSAKVARCAPAGSLRFERARLTVLLRSPLRLGRLPHFQALLVSPHVRVREAALEALETHPEALTSEWVGPALVRALASREAGEIIAALGAASKLPEDKNREIGPAFAAAAARVWPADASELFVALLTLGRARHLEGTDGLAKAHRCDGAQPVRRLAREIVQDTSECPLLPVPTLATAPVTLVLESDAGPLTLHLDPSAAPASVAEIVRLARSGFYDHVEMHRVVPGFVVQFGDPQGDGYGGSGSLLRHEASDRPFAPLAVGLAHAGFDTASSQLFVTVGPARHLDGDYTWLGTAEGAWQDVVAGDLVRGVKITAE